MDNDDNQNIIQFTQGDNNVVLNLTAQDGLGNPVNLTGASFSTQVLGPNGGSIATFPNGQHVANPDQVGNPGKFTLTLANSGADTAACGVGYGKQILTTITIGGAIVTYRGVGILNVFPPTPTQ